MERTQTMMESPGMYSVLNWLTSGFPDIAKGAAYPEKPLSLEHWMDSIGVASAVYGALEVSKQAAARIKSSKKSVKDLTESLANTSDIRFRVDKPVTPIEISYEMRLNPELYIEKVVGKYGINLKGSGQKISIKFNPDYTKGPGYVSELYPRTIILGSQAMASESELANTIAHELNHWRSWLKGGIAPEPPAYEAGDSLSDYINGGR